MGSMAWSQVKTLSRLSFLLTVPSRVLKSCVLSTDLVTRGHTAIESKEKAAPGVEFGDSVCSLPHFLGSSLTCPFSPQKCHSEPEWVLAWTEPHPSYRRTWTLPVTVCSSPASTVLDAARHVGLKEEMGQWSGLHRHTVKTDLMGETIHRVLDRDL